MTEREIVFEGDVAKVIMKRIIGVVILGAVVAFGACSRANVRSADNEDPQTSQLIPRSEQKRNLPEQAIAFDYSNHLYFDVLLRDSISARMIFDTGNTNLLMDTKFYKKYFAPSDNLQRIVIQGSGNSLEAAYRDVGDWSYKVGEHSKTEQGAVVMDLRKILGNEVDGMFGMEFMRGRKVEINYADEYMLIVGRDEQPSEGYTRIKCESIDKRGSKILMPLSIKLNDKISFDGKFIVDLGSSGGVSLNSGVAAKLGLNRALTNVRKKIYDTGGVGGSRTDYIFKAKSISVGGVELVDMRATFSGNTQGIMANNEYAGIVGNAFFERFDVIFDFKRGEIWLRPNRNFNISEQYDSGMTLTPQDEGWVVNGLIEGGNAHRAGVRRGDFITSINGLSRQKISYKALKMMNRSAEEWRVVVKRGESSSEIEFRKEKI